ncbi:SLC13 family permease [Candidatus Electrothrix sp.]|uniref:SLC13 family permease n=1 Tax=Candidatus Electrothrix sp. TaxID=2170559 RepID=UPI0040562AF7
MAVMAVMAEDKKPASTQSIVIKVVVALALAVGIIFLPRPQNLTPEGQRFLGLLAAVVFLWVSEAVPIGTTALLAASGLIFLKIQTAQAAWTPFASPATMFVLMIIMFGVVLNEVGLANRLLFYLLKFAGTKVKRLTDAAVAGIGDADLFINRSYNSAATQTDAASIYEFTEDGRDGEKVEGPPQYFGKGWSSNLNSFLLKLDYAPIYEEVQILFPDGHTQNFIKDGSGYKADTPDNFDVLTEDGGDFLLTRKHSQESWKFGSDGNLLEIKDKNGNTITYTYSGELLSKISDGNRSITFQHDGNGHITEARLPEGA